MPEFFLQISLVTQTEDASAFCLCFFIISVHAKQLCKVCAYSFDGNVQISIEYLHIIFYYICIYRRRNMHIFDYSFNEKCTPLNYGELVEKRECLSVKFMLENICLA